MEYIEKKNEKQKLFFSANNYCKYNNINNNNQEKANFIIASKNNTIISKKRKKREWLIQKRQKDQKLFNSKKYYLYGILYNKLFLILNVFILFFYISSSKQNTDLNKSFKSKIIITISGTGIKSIFGNDFHYKPDAIIINDNKTNLDETSEYKNFQMNKEENIIKVYYSNPPDSLRNMFSYNHNIKKIDFSHFDTSKVTDMYNMFSNCNELEYINMTGINTSSVTNMGAMFQSIPKLTSLDLSSFNTSSVTSMECMFCSCNNLVHLNISKFNTSSVKIMSHMFSSCVSLESIDLSSFSTNKELDMTKMFYYCIKLKTIKFQKKNKIFGFNMGYLFQECSSLTSLDLSNFDTSFTSNINGMFERCLSLTSIDLSSFNTSNIINMDNMFKQCRKLEFLDLSNFDTKSVISMEGMFSECDSLIYLNLKSFIIHNSTNIKYIFSGNSLKICCNQEFEALIKNNFSYINNCSDICFSDTKKIVSELKKCIKDCNTDNNEYKYEYNNKCFEKCPEGTFSSPNNQFLCIEAECEYYNINKTECFQDFPEGYYIYDNEKKIIDKCHKNCKTCNKKGDESNNNCITCNNDYFFEDGNCVINCTYNSYIDDNGNNMCTCSSNIKCKECSKESLQNDLCISCNNEEGFYTTYYETLNYNNLKNCYNNFTGNYLKDNIYYPCSLMCFSCSKGGDLFIHNCDECNSNYTFLNETDKKGNCYQKCENYYYFDESDKYQCTNTRECPSSQSKLITEKGKCIDECFNDDTYKYEYNNKCYKKCPDNQICKNKKEEDNLTQRIYDNTELAKKTEELSIQITQYKESEVPETSQFNIPTVSETQEITEELTLETTQNTEIKIKETTQIQINIPTIPFTQKITEKLAHETIPDTSQTSKTNQHNIPINSDTQNVETNWDSRNFFFGLFDKKEINISKDDIINNIKEDIIKHKIDNLLSNVTERKEDLYIKNEDVLYQITTTDNQKNNIYNNISSIKLGECENILKGIYGIDENQTLIILKIDYYLEGLLIPIIGYEVYDPKNKSKLNLSYCNETLISYNIPVTIDENNLFKYDQNSEYYNDECNIYTTEDGTDILINDRKEEFIQNNMSLCENICTYTGYDKNNKKALCECGIKYQEFILSDIEKQTDLLSNNLTMEDNSNSNLGTMKCYQTLFSKDGLLTNIGSYILLFIIIVHMISTILFYKCGYYILENKIKYIISKIKKKSKLSNCSKFKKNEIHRSKSIKIKIKKKKANKKSKFKNSNPSKKVKKSNKYITSTQEKTDKSNNKLSKIKHKNKKFNIYTERDPNRSTVPLGKFSDKSFKLSQKLNKNKNINNYNDFELNSLNYKDALEIDKRTYLEYYKSLLRTKHPIIFTFYPIKDNNILIIKICLFCLSFSIYYFFNTVFFTYNKIHKVYEDKGSYNISYFMQSIIFSFIFSYIINIFIKYFSLSERNLAELKNEKMNKKLFDKQIKVQRCLIIKYICYFIISFIFLMFFWYYLSSFCAVYQNSQVYVIKNTFISFIIGLIYPFFINLFPGIFRLYSLNNKKVKKEFIYKISKFLQFL